MCKTMILSIWLNESPCWYPNVKPLKRLERVQKHVTTWMVGSKYYKASLQETHLFPISLYLPLTDALVLSGFIQSYYDVEDRNFVELHSNNRQTRHSQYTHFVEPLILFSGALSQNSQKFGNNSQVIRKRWIETEVVVNLLVVLQKFL